MSIWSRQVGFSLLRRPGKVEPVVASGPASPISNFIDISSRIGMLKPSLLLVLSLLPCPALPADWLQYSSENFTVYSDVKPAHVLQQVQDFEVYRRAVLMFLGFEDQPENKDARVYIFDSDKEFREYAGAEGIAGYYRYQLNGPTMVMSRLKSRGAKRQDAEQNLVLFHEYVHYLLRERGGANYPKWYDEGLSDLLGAAKIEKGKVGIGASNPWRHSVARDKTLLKVEHLIEPPLNTNWRQAAGFYPTSWLLTHYLVLGHLDGEPYYAGKLQAFLTAYAQGAVKVEDFEKILGIKTRELDKKLAAYTGKGYLMGYSIPVKPYSGEIRQRKVTDNEMLYHKADLLSSADRESKAKLQLALNQKGKPFYFQNLSLKAIMLGNAGDHDQALALIDEALASDANDATVLANATHVLTDKLEALKEQGEWNEALYQRAHELGTKAYRHPDKTLVAAQNLWSLYEVKGDHRRAAEMMMEIYQVTPSRIELNYAIAEFLLKTGSLEAALPFLEKVLLFSHEEIFKNTLVEQIKHIKRLLAEQDETANSIVE